MDNLNLISNFAEFKELKNIDKSTMIGVLEDVFRHALQKQYETDENFDVIINPEKGDLEIWRNRTVVADGEVENPNAQIAVSEVKAIDPTYEVGDEYADEIKLSSFGRRTVLSLRQNLASRILDLEKASLYEKYSQQVGEIITGEVYQVWKREVLILDEDENELILPKAEQIPNDFYRKGDTIKAIVKAVEMNNNQPRIILSRTANQFLERLFEQEVPEIADGLITIKKIARIPGERAKVAVESYDERIDPVGACVGMKGSRIYGIVKELRNENIDVVNYTTNPADDPAFAQSGQDLVDHHRRGEADRFGLSQTRSGVAGHRQGRSEHPPVEDAHRLRHRRLPRGRGGGRRPERIQGRDRCVDHRRAESRRMRYGEERAGTFGRGDRFARRSGNGAGPEGGGDSQSRIRITRQRKENRQYGK